MPTYAKPTERARARYDRIAWVYDWAELLVERLVFRGWRRKLWEQMPKGRGLEVGVGTGKNIPFYRSYHTVTAVDLSPKMLERAKSRKRRLGADAQLEVMDAEHLDYPDDSFDWAVATFVFCSVPDPIVGLQELGRVVKPQGSIYLLEHVRINRPLIGPFMDLVNPLALRLTGANINRNTLRNVEKAGLVVEWVENMAILGLAKLIIARPGLGP